MFNKLLQADENNLGWTDLQIAQAHLINHRFEYQKLREWEFLPIIG